MEDRETTPYPFIIFQGDLDSPANNVYLAAGKKQFMYLRDIHCWGNSSLVGHVLCFYVWMSTRLCKLFFVSTKMHFADRRWKKAAIIHHTLCKFSTWHKGRHSRGDWSLKQAHETNPFLCAGLKGLTNWTVLIATCTCRVLNLNGSFTWSMVYR